MEDTRRDQDARRDMTIAKPGPAGPVWVTQIELTRLRHEAMQAEADALSAQLESRL